MTTPSKKQIFEIPTMSLATGDLKEGTPEYFKEAIRQHGSTNPLKLQARRAAMTAKATILEREIKNLQDLKKAAKVENEAVIKQAEKVLKSESDPKKVEALTEQIKLMQIQAKQQERNFEMMISNATVNFCTIEGLCLIIDSLTIRVKVKAKGGKEGYRRYSIAGFMSDFCWDIQYLPALFRMLKKHINPLGIPPQDDPDSEEFKVDDEEIDDEEVLTEEEEQRMKKAEEEE